MTAATAYLEHTAITVRDIGWHIRFFAEVFGMGCREVDGDPAAPRQYWTVGGIQLIHDPDHGSPEGRLAHLGLMCEDLDAALAAAHRFGVIELPKGRNWLQLPDGLRLELMQAAPAASVAQALTIDPRAEA